MRGRCYHRLVITSCVIAFASAPASAASCDTAAHRDFDFWLGQWEVQTPDGKLAGTNRIEREYGGCVLHERYSTPKGYSGESLNIYDASRKVWHQTWVDSTGTLLLLEGGVRDGKMVLEGQTTAGEVPLTRHRITWTPNADGSVRQFWSPRTAGASGPRRSTVATSAGELLTWRHSPRGP